MPYQAVGLVLFSCLLHAFWNLLVKRARDKLAFTALFLAATPIVYLPLLPHLLSRAAIPLAGWACVLGTGLAYFGYFVGLARAYDGEQLSVAYPIMRSVAPVLVLLWGALLLGERPTLLGLIGIGLILLGTVMLLRPGKGSGKQTGRLKLSPALVAALIVALMTSFYSLIDKIGVGRVQVYPPLYIYLTYAVSALTVVPWVVWRKGVGALRAEWRINRWPCLAVAFSSFFTYLLVLWAMALPNTPVSYIVPLRSASVLFGVLLGVEALKEGGLYGKLTAALVMMGGITLMAWKG